MNRKLISLILVIIFAGLMPDVVLANDAWQDKFRQLEEEWPTPTIYRNASGAPGVQYWQQQADYKIDVRLDDKKQKIEGRETIRYYNNSPDTLNYLWVQLENNRFSNQSHAKRSQTLRSDGLDDMSYRGLRRLLADEKFDGSLKIENVKQANGEDFDFTIVDTMMRVDLPQPLLSGAQVELSIEWHYLINDAVSIPSRTGYEYFEADQNYLYEIAHWYPRMAAYTDVNGWQNKAFLGSGEFTLVFGDFDVQITVPSDHIVAATGQLQNPDEVLTDQQIERLKSAKSARVPIYIVTPEEAKENQKKQSKKEKTWHFKAENVRDFAFASSRKFIWDAMPHRSGQTDVMAMSYFPIEAEPLWSKYSTHAIVHTLEIYSKYTFDYPYPVAISVNGPIGGMEYPMISFNKPRPVEDGTYFGETVEGKWWQYTKYGLISVIIHEVGHYYFPMIVNSDERQWTWMDEGLNTFLQFIAEQEWETDYPSRRGEPKDIVEYMISENQVPIMTNSESVMQFGNNAYGKPATALNILRETILGRDLFDYAFRTYAMRWQFKHPMPSDFFRTMEDASGVDLDWFWRGWFYTTDHVDIGIESVEQFRLDTLNPKLDKADQRKERDEAAQTLSQQRFASVEKRVDKFPELKDFYNSYDELDVTESDKIQYQEKLDELEDWEKALLKDKTYFYVLNLANHGGLVMPVILKLYWKGGDVEMLTMPAESWRYNPEKIQKLLLSDKELIKLEIDPYLETADSNVENNYWPSRTVKRRFQLHKDKRPDNPMQQALKDAKSADKKKH